MNQLLEGKTALVFGAKGALGSQVAMQFKNAGAKVYLSDIQVEGDYEEKEIGIIRKLNTLDEDALEKYFDWFMSENVLPDIVINLTSSDPGEFNHGRPASEVSLKQFLMPFGINTASQFLTAKYAKDLMVKNGTQARR